MQIRCQKVLAQNAQMFSWVLKINKVIGSIQNIYNYLL